MIFSLFRKVLGKREESIDLINNGEIRVDCLDKSGMTPLDQACFKGDEDLAAFLISKGANVDNRFHEQGYTCLMFAALAGRLGLCKFPKFPR